MKVPQDEKDGLLPILVIVDEKSGCVFSGVVAKGVNAHATGLVAEALQFCGRQKVIMMTDAEHSIKALAESAAKIWKGIECPTPNSTEGITCIKGRGRKSHFGVGSPGAYPCKCF